MSGIDRNKLIRMLCISLVAATLVLSLILLVTVCGGRAAPGAEEETTRRGYRPTFPDQLPNPDDLPGSLDWEGWPDSDRGTGDGPTLPPEPEVTLPDWESGWEWPTLPPSLETDPDFEWPTLPEGWDTLPEEWDTLPEEWGDVELPEDIGDYLAGMDGSLDMPPGALGAGIASQLTVMEIYAEKDDRVYLMMQAFGDYTGQGWNAAASYKGETYGHGGVYGYPNYYMNGITPFHGYPLTVTPKMDVRVLPYYFVPQSDDPIQQSDVKAEGTADGPYTVYYRPYSVYAGPSGVDPFIAKYQEEYKDYVKKTYRRVDTATAAYMNLIIEQEGFDKKDPDVIQKVAAYIQSSATYNLAYDQNLDREPNVALAFLGAYKEGVCRHYATAATLLYRTLGFPARYVVGFMTDVRGGQTTAVKGMDAHAWVEVYVEDFGWQCVEVTGSLAGTDPGGTPGTGTGTGTQPGGDPGTETLSEPADTEAPTDPSEDPKTWGDLLAGVDGRFSQSTSIPPAMLNSTVFSVTADSAERLLLKMKSFGDYDGHGFLSAPPCDILIYEAVSPAYLPSIYLIQHAHSVQSVRIESPMGAYAVPYFVSVNAIAQGITVGDTRVTGNGLENPYTVYYYPYEDDYSPKSLAYLAEEDIRIHAARYYSNLDPVTAAYLHTVIEAQGWRGNDPDVIRAVADYLRETCVVNPAYPSRLDAAENVVISFLQDVREGSSRHFAAAATMFYRAMGIPARYTVGYLAEAPAGATVQVKGSDAYAWVEVYVDGFGWSPVDVAGNNTAEDAVFKVQLKPKDQLVRYDGNSHSHTGELEGFELFEAKGYTYKADVSAKRKGCGRTTVTVQSLTIYNPEGLDVTHLFDVELSPGLLFVYLEELSFASPSQTKSYDGIPLRAEQAALLAGSLPEDYFLEIIPTHDQTGVGTGYAAFDVVVWYRQSPTKQVDRTHEYFLIHKQYGTLTVTPRALTVKAADAEKVYDGEALTASSIEITDGTLAEGDYIHRYTVEGSQTRVGRSENTVTQIVIRNKDGEDVTRSYAIETVAGVLKVTAPS